LQFIFGSSTRRNNEDKQNYEIISCSFLNQILLQNPSASKSSVIGLN